MSSHTEFPTVEHQSESLLQPRKMVGLVDWKTADQHLMETHTRLLQRLSPPPSQLTDLIRPFEGAQRLGLQQK